MADSNDAATKSDDVVAIVVRGAGGTLTDGYGPTEDLSAEVEAAARRFTHIPANQLALSKLLINQAYENMRPRTTGARHVLR